MMCTVDLFNQFQREVGINLVCMRLFIMILKFYAYINMVGYYILQHKGVLFFIFFSTFYIIKASICILDYCKYQFAGVVSSSC